MEVLAGVMEINDLMMHGFRRDSARTVGDSGDDIAACDACSGRVMLAVLYSYVFVPEDRVFFVMTTLHGMVNRARVIRRCRTS